MLMAQRSGNMLANGNKNIPDALFFLLFELKNLAFESLNGLLLSYSTLLPKTIPSHSSLRRIINKHLSFLWGILLFESEYVSQRTANPISNLLKYSRNFLISSA